MDRKKHIVFIVDSVDCSGKDFLINRLSKSLRSSITIKNNFRPDKEEDSDSLQEKYYYIYKVIKKNKVFDYIIINRYYFSELVYSKVKRDYDALEDPWYQDIERYLHELKKVEVIWLYVTADIKEIKERMKIRKEEFILEEDIEKLIERYEEVFANCTLRKFRVKSDVDIDKLLEDVKNG